MQRVCAGVEGPGLVLVGHGVLGSRYISPRALLDGVCRPNLLCWCGHIQML